MKVLPFILFFVYFQDVLCYNSDLLSSMFFLPANKQKLPKKNLQIVISKKFVNNKPISLITKKPDPLNKRYTAFPPIGVAEKKLFNVPDSPYFPLDHNDEQNRVKKVLPDYVIGALRRKRSAELKLVDEKLNLNEQDAKIIKVEDAQPSKKTHKNKSKKSRRRSQSKNKTRAKTGSKAFRDQDKTKRSVDLKYTKRPAKRSRPDKPKAKRNKSSRKRSRDEKPKQVEETRRLIAAKDATIEDYPYVVSIQKNDEHWCAGALLNPRVVITTANCIWKSSRVSNLQVRAGSRHSNHGGQEAKIQEVIKHPLWNIRKNPDNDVALILLDRRIKFSHAVHGVDLPNRVMLPAFKDAWVTSWGAERRDGIYDKRGMGLQVYHSRLMDRAKCNNVTQRFGVTVTDNFICLAQTGRRAPCTRDTGAPAVSDGVLWGLASWGIRKLCGTERFPAMFSYLASQSNMDFLLNATHYLMADERFYPFPDRFPTGHVQVTLAPRPELPFY